MAKKAAKPDLQLVVDNTPDAAQATDKPAAPEQVEMPFAIVNGEAITRLQREEFVEAIDLFLQLEQPQIDTAAEQQRGGECERCDPSRPDSGAALPRGRHFFAVSVVAGAGVGGLANAILLTMSTSRLRSSSSSSAVVLA